MPTWLCPCMAQPPSQSRCDLVMQRGLQLHSQVSPGLHFRDDGEAALMLVLVLVLVQVHAGGKKKRPRS